MKHYHYALMWAAYAVFAAAVMDGIVENLSVASATWMCCLHTTEGWYV